MSDDLKTPNHDGSEEFQLRPVGFIELLKLYREANPQKQLAEAKHSTVGRDELERFARERGLTLQGAPGAATAPTSKVPERPKQNMSDDELREAHDFQKAVLKSHEEAEPDNFNRPPSLPAQAKMEDRMEAFENEMERRKLDDYAHLSGTSTLTPSLAATNIPIPGLQEDDSYMRPDGDGTYKRPDGGDYLRPSGNTSQAVPQPTPSSDASSNVDLTATPEDPLSKIPFKELVDHDLGPRPDTIDGWRRRIATLKMIRDGHDEDNGPRPKEDSDLLANYLFEAESELNTLIGFPPDDADTSGEFDKEAAIDISDHEISAAHELWTELMTRQVSRMDFMSIDHAAAFESLARLFSITRDIIAKISPTRYFEPVALEFLQFLRPLMMAWHEKFVASKTKLSDEEQKNFRSQLHRFSIRIYGILKALDAIRHGRAYQSKWVTPDEQELEELRKEAGIPALDESPPGSSKDDDKASNNTRAEDAKAPKKELGGKFVASRQASEEELCLSIDTYAAALALTFESAVEENDFVFALYGPWGRGKSTLITKVSSMLKQSIGKETDAPYESVVFSAWKYPTRPEVWIHLYQCLVAEAQAGGWLQKARISLRVGLVKNGWWPLLFGFGLLAISRLQLDFGQWVFHGMGLIGLLILGSFVWNAVKTGRHVASSYFTMPDHAEKLGLQAVIGEDVKYLLKVWARPKPTKQEATATPPSFDFSKWWPARWAMISVVMLIWTTLGCVAWKIHHHLPEVASKGFSQSSLSATQPTEAAPTTIVAPPDASKLEKPMRIEINTEWQGIKLHWTGTSTAKGAEMQAVRTESSGSILLLDIVFGALAIAAPVFAYLISKRPRECKRVLLVVDDLDRCDPDQMLAVIESLRMFLDEPEMSRRMQVAMLLDRNILKSAMINRAEMQKLRLIPDSQAEFFRQQEEKLFVVSMALPPIDHDMLASLAMRMVKQEVQQQAAAAPEPLAPDKEKTTSPPGSSAGSTAEKPTSGASPKVGTDKLPSNMPKQPAAPSDEAVRRILSDVQFSMEEQVLLVETLARFDVSNITPRSYRAFVLRYQLVRLILNGFNAPFEPSEVIVEIARRLFACKEVLPLPVFSTEVLKAINSVVVNDDR